MRPTSIPDDLAGPDAVVRTFDAPADHDQRLAAVDPCDALVTGDPDTGLALVHVRIALEPGDLDQLAEHGHLWLTTIGGLMPFHLTVDAPET